MSTRPTVSTSSSSSSITRTPSAKRKRTAGSPTTRSPGSETDSPSQPSNFPLDAPLLQIEKHLNTTLFTESEHPRVPPAPKGGLTQMIFPPPTHVFRAGTPLSTPPGMALRMPFKETLESSFAASIGPTEADGKSWKFLAHPALRLLPKWPALYTNSSPITAASRKRHAEQQAAEELDPVKRGSKPMNLKTLLSIPPIAASVIRNLYGHDLRNLRQLSHDFYILLSSRLSTGGNRPYYHALLLKTLLCPRTDLQTEPFNTPCLSAGGNVGPCVFCDTIICSTCVSPEVWTTRRYRYVCPPCANTPLDSAPVCTCQQNLWICRPCYKQKWLADLMYSARGWFSSTNPTGCSAVTCGLCLTTHTRETDKRIPANWSAEMGFAEWMTVNSNDAVIVRGKGKGRQRGQGKREEEVKKEGAMKGDKSGGEREGEMRRRPVACAWCVRRIDPEKEEWGLRPEKIKRGEERGKRWMQELERRRVEKEAEIAAAAAATAAATAAVQAETITSGSGSNNSVDRES